MSIFVLNPDAERLLELMTIMFDELLIYTFTFGTPIQHQLVVGIHAEPYAYQNCSEFPLLLLPVLLLFLFCTKLLNVITVVLFLTLCPERFQRSSCHLQIILFILVLLLYSIWCLW